MGVVEEVFFIFYNAAAHPPVTSHVCVDDAGVHVVDDDVVAALVKALLLNPGRLSSHVARFHNCTY